MRRITISILIVCFSILSFSQRVQNSKWSLALEVGANQFDGDMTPSATKTTIGTSMEYTISPTWGLGIEYYYLPL
jgi:hypothetical protein